MTIPGMSCPKTRSNFKKTTRPNNKEVKDKYQV